MKNMKKITQDEVKKIELGILNYISEVCQQNNIRYYLMAGTLIGAIRHKGFIPWDDDIDIGMPRPDYNKFKNIVGDRLHNDRFRLLSYEYGNLDYNFMKMIDDRTVVYEKYISGSIGVWVDIFPIDGLPPNPVVAKILCCNLEFWRRLLNIRNAKKDIATKKNRIFLKRIIAPVAECFSVRFLCNRINGIFKNYNYDECIFVGAVSGGFSYKARISKDVYEQTMLEFEGERYMAPVGSDKLLTQLYGDYMQLPPIEDRVPHQFDAFWKC